MITLLIIAVAAVLGLLLVGVLYLISKRPSAPPRKPMLTTPEQEREFQPEAKPRRHLRAITGRVQ